MMEVGLCECGCGQATSLALRTQARRGHIKGQPVRFVHGHNMQGVSTSKEKYDPIAVDPNPSGRCLCGCGQPTEKITRTDRKKGHQAGHHLRYIVGHNNWTGEQAAYSTKHNWISFHKTKTGVCSDCKTEAGFGRSGTHWSNVDHKYARKLEDYTERCSTCHAAYDKANGLRFVSDAP